MRYSVIIPVYNRPDEVDELLQSLTTQHFKDFEVIVVEDGSSVPCEAIVNKYQGKLDIHYYAKPNSGPGQTRNYGAERSGGGLPYHIRFGLYPSRRILRCSGTGTFCHPGRCLWRTGPGT